MTDMVRCIEELSQSYEELRSLALEALKRIKSSTQFVGLYSFVAWVAVERGFSPNPYANTNIMGPTELALSKKDEARLQDIIWDLLIEGVIRPGLGDGLNSDLPFFHITEYGRGIISGMPISPYDPEGYLKQLQRDIPEIDPVILTYLEESLHTFRIGCLLSSTITLGCASEKALLLLISTYTNALPETTGSKFRRNTEGRFIKRQFDEFSRMLNCNLMPQLPGDLKDGLENILSGVFSMIRIQRNDAGHPTGREIAREQAYANIVVFPTYLKRVYDLIRWIDSKSILE